MLRNNAGKSLLKLLEDERHALLAGDIAGAAKLSDRKAALLDRFEPGTADRRLVAEIGERAAYNHGLLDAARRGVETARARLASIFDARPGDTYSAYGRKEQLRSVTPSLQRRA